MPRIQVQENRSYRRDELVKLLADELGRNAGSGQPLIVETRIGPTDDLQVVVLWERWTGVPVADRAGIVQDAYESALPETAPRVVIAMGVTMEEGMDLGILPHAVALIPNEGFNEKRPDLVTAMQDEGAVLTRRGWQLRFPTEELAKQALERLSRKFPGFWALQRDVSTVDG